MYQNQQSTNQEWHVDSGAIIYLTNNINNLNIYGEEYDDTNQIQVDGGSYLYITNIDIVSLPTPLKYFDLDNILVMPQIIKNLISVKKFTWDNNVYFEFMILFY